MNKLVTLCSLVAAVALTAALAPTVADSSFTGTQAIAVDAESPADLVRAAGADAGDGWISWQVAGIPGRRSCCWAGPDTDRRPCRLEDESSYRSDDDLDAVESSTAALRVFVRLDDGRPDRIRAYSADCVVDARGLRLFDGGRLDPSTSVEWLGRVVVAHGDGESDLRDQALVAVSGHAGPDALDALTGWTDDAHPVELRKNAAFWLGAARGAEGWPRLVEIIDDDPSADVREHAVFALSLVDEPAALEALIRAARRNADGDVRRQALFWLAQKAGERATETLREAVEDDPLSEVRQHAVFALSQLPPDRGVPLLIELARDHRDPEVRQQALFWLGQSGDPRALDAIEALLR